MRIACVQSNVVYGNPLANANIVVEKLEIAKESGVDIAVFPEAFLTGYCAGCYSEAAGISIAADDEPLLAIQRACERLDLLAVVGFAESDGKFLHNSAALFEPGKEMRIYRKSHLPELGLDKFVIPGKALPVWDTRLGKIGILICFDLRIPEAARVLALEGAQLLILPTNWPEGATVSSEHICIARAAENRVFVATCNRVGEENDFRFIGRSKIIGVTGQVLASAHQDAEEIIMADIDLSEASVKRTTTLPGLYEIEVFASRKPSLYGKIVER